MLEREKLGGVLLNAQHNFAWLTGGARNGIDLSREHGAANLLVTASGRRYVLATNIEMPRLLAEEISADVFDPVEYSWQDEKCPSDIVLNNVRRLTAGDIASDIGINSQMRTIESLIARCRYSLTDGEIDRLRTLGSDASAALHATVGKIAPGSTESEIAGMMTAELDRFGIAAVVTLVAADERIALYRHPVPSDRKWQKTLLLVTCAKRCGLIVSLSRMICSGSVPDDLKRKTEAAAYVNASLLNATKPGTTGAELYETARQAYETAGFGDEINLHHQGGAAGYRTRDWVAHPTSTESVQPNQALAWNPSITGTKVEETCISGAAGTEIVTDIKGQPTIITMIEGREYHSPDIISI